MFSLALKNAILTLILILVFHVAIKKHLLKRQFTRIMYEQLPQMQIEMQHTTPVREEYAPNVSRIQKDEDELFNFIKECAKPLSPSDALSHMHPSNPQAALSMATSTNLQTNALGPSLGTFAKFDYAPF
jgi:hypothetical protein